MLYDPQFSTDPGRMKALRNAPPPGAPGWARGWLEDDHFRAPAAVWPAREGPPEVLRAVGQLDGLVALTIRPEVLVDAHPPATPDSPPPSPGG